MNFTSYFTYFTLILPLLLFRKAKVLNMGNILHSTSEKVTYCRKIKKLPNNSTSFPKWLHLIPKVKELASERVRNRLFLEITAKMPKQGD